MTTPQPAAALIASFDVLAEDRAGLERLFRTLTDRIAFLMKGGEAATLDPRYPAPDNGLLGPRVFPDNLTVTVALGASLFDERYGLQKLRPTRLIAMEQFPNDALEAHNCHGDVVLQFCSNTAETNIHALRDILRHTPDLLALRWKIDGFLPPHTIKKLGKETVRNLLGFKDGTANLDASDETLMNEIVWAQPNADEPAWTSGGTYQVVRVIRIFVERWDRDALIDQEQIIGREKASGAPLTYANERDVPDYAADPKGERVPLTAHIRLANPRTPGDPGQPDFAQGLQLFARRDERRPARHGTAVCLLSVGPRRRLSHRAIAPQRRAARGVHQAGGRGVFFRPAGRPIEGRFLRRRSLARGGVEGPARPQRLARGLRFGHLTIRSGQCSGARSLSLDDTRPRTETPASCTLSGEPDTSGCQL